MTLAGLHGGAAIPAGWTAPAALLASREAGNLVIRSTVADIDLLAKIDLTSWPVRNQGHRGACNAFAAVAAEELVRKLGNQGNTHLSEEALHLAIRQQGKAPLKVGRPPRKHPVLVDRGESYLEEVQKAMHLTGFRLAGNQVFDIDPLLPVNHVQAGGLGISAPVAPAGEYLHNIKWFPKGGLLDWHTPLPEGKTVVSVFYDALGEGKPVVAAVPIFDVPGMNVFTSAKARQFGRVTYPPKDIAETLEPVDGHAICLVGYKARSKDKLDGQFVFRNAFGTEAFARDVTAGSLPGPGYGMIEAIDIERWCWEYLYRA